MILMTDVPKIYEASNPGEKVEMVIDLDNRFYVFSANNVLYFMNKRNEEWGSYNPLDDSDRFSRALENNKIVYFT